MKKRSEFIKVIDNLFVEKKFEDVIKLLGDSVLQEYKTPLLYDALCEAYLGLKDYQKAIEVIETSKKLFPKDPLPYNGFAKIYHALKQYDKGIEVTKKAIELNPNNEYSYNALGILYLDSRDYQSAIDSFEKAVSINSKNPYPYNGLGIAYGSINQYNKALEALNKAIELRPHSPRAYHNRAAVFFELKKYKESLSDYKRYIDLKKNISDYYTSLAKSKIVELKKIIDNSLYSEINDLVNQIKEVLLLEDECITHYTSLSVAKALVLEDSLFRLSEGAFLNDTSEGRELFKYLLFHVDFRQDGDTVAEKFAQKPFIGSFVSENKHDDLTLWRMYGKEQKEEAKGCAITIRRKEFLDGLKAKMSLDTKEVGVTQIEQEFHFFRVAYKKNKEELDFVIPGADMEKETKLNSYMKDLATKIKTFNSKRRKKLSDSQNILELLNSIAYLFKSEEYQYENELRLVIKGIGLEKNISLIADQPRVYIELVAINSTIHKITLGPKVDRAEEWAAAFHYSLEKKGCQSNIFISHLPFK